MQEKENNTILDTPPLPEGVTESDILRRYSYEGEDMIPISRENAEEFFNENLCVFYSSEKSGMVVAETSEDLDKGDTYIIPISEWEQSRYFHRLVMDRFNHQEEREQALLSHEGDCFGIYQLKNNDENLDLRYMSMDWLMKNDIPVERDNFNLVYTAPFNQKGSIFQNLESLFEDFNISHPVDYHSPSLSVGDVIALKEKGKMTCYFVDRIGFVELENFIKHKEVKKEHTNEVKKSVRERLKEVSKKYHKTEQLKRTENIGERN